MQGLGFHVKRPDARMLYAWCLAYEAHYEVPRYMRIQHHEMKAQFRTYLTVQYRRADGSQIDWKQDALFAYPAAQARVDAPGHH